MRKPATIRVSPGWTLSIVSRLEHLCANPIRRSRCFQLNPNSLPRRVSIAKGCQVNLKSRSRALTSYFGSSRAASDKERNTGGGRRCRTMSHHSVLQRLTPLHGAAESLWRLELWNPCSGWIPGEKLGERSIGIDLRARPRCDATKKGLPWVYIACRFGWRPKRGTSATVTPPARVADCQTFSLVIFPQKSYLSTVARLARLLGPDCDGNGLPLRKRMRFADFSGTERRALTFMTFIWIQSWQ